MFSVSEASVAVITGGSSGIGLNAARALRDRGLNVYELSRRAENAEPGVTHLQADVTDETQVNAAVAEILRREGRIDILINNAGFGISGAIEFTPPPTHDCTEHHPIAVNALSNEGRCAPFIPNVILAKRGNGIPYLVPTVEFN